MIVVESRHEEGNPSIFHRPTLASEPGQLRALQLFDTAGQDFLLEPMSLAHTHPLTTPYEDCFRWDAVVHKVSSSSKEPTLSLIYVSLTNSIFAINGL